MVVADIPLGSKVLSKRIFYAIKKIVFILFIIGCIWFISDWNLRSLFDGEIFKKCDLAKSSQILAEVDEYMVSTAILRLLCYKLIVSDRLFCRLLKAWFGILSLGSSESDSLFRARNTVTRLTRRWRSEMDENLCHSTCPKRRCRWTWVPSTNKDWM